MATLKKVVSNPSKPAVKMLGHRPQVQVAVAKSANPIDLIHGAKVMDVSTIEFVGREGGRSASPEVAALREKISELELGQGFIIPKGLRVDRKITNASTGVESTIRTYKGANTVSKFAKANGVRYRSRLDKSGNLWIFRVEALVVVESDEEEGGE
jgi:hypothetical protein